MKHLTITTTTTTITTTTTTTTTTTNNNNNNNNTNDDDNNTNDNTTTNNNTSDKTNDSKIRDKISDIRMILSRLRNTITNKDKKKIKNKFYKIEKKQNLSDVQKEKIYDHLVELVRTLDKKEKYKYHNCETKKIYLIILMIMITTNQY